MTHAETMKPFRYTFTVFTPTFNRLHTLHRPFESLAAQTFRDFEWLIVDDGSTDGTADLCRELAASADFPIRYCHQQNTGKAGAISHGVEVAEGMLFVILDSDDWCTPNALARFWQHWSEVPGDRREAFSGVTCLCVDTAGHPIGSPFDADVMDANLDQMRRAGKLAADRWGFHRTEVMKEFPFPRFSGEKFTSEGIVWNRIGRKYKMRFVNEPLRIVEYRDDGLSAGRRFLRASSPLGARLYYEEYIELPLAPLQLIKGTLNFGRYSLHAGLSPLPHSPSILLLASSMLLLPGSIVLYIIDRVMLARTKLGGSTGNTAS